MDVMTLREAVAKLRWDEKIALCETNSGIVWKPIDLVCHLDKTPEAKVAVTVSGNKIKTVDVERVLYHIVRGSWTENGKFWQV